MKLLAREGHEATVEVVQPTYAVLSFEHLPIIAFVPRTQGFNTATFLLEDWDVGQKIPDIRHAPADGSLEMNRIFCTSTFVPKQKKVILERVGMDCCCLILSRKRERMERKIAREKNPS